MRTFTLSIVLNLHREGILAQKTLQNLRQLLLCAKQSKNWNAIEIVAVLDNSDDSTKKVILDNRDIIQSYEDVNYGDLALSRNHGVTLARHQFVLFADGDDYLSHNTLIALYRKFFFHYSKYTKQHIAVFPALLVEFPNLLFQRYRPSNNFMMANMRFEHCYVSRIACLKEILLKNPLRKNEHPYGSEDWDLNNRLLAQGVKFKVVSGFTLYYRRGGATSLMDNQTKNKCIVRNSDMYRKNFIFNNDSVTCNLLKKYSFYFYRLTHFIIKKTLFQYFVKQHAQFLDSYGEKTVNEISPARFGDTKLAAILFSTQTISYEKIVKFLNQKQIVILADTVSSSIMSLLTQYGDQAAIIFTKKHSSKIIAAHSVLYFTENLNEDMKSHILLKALTNSDTLQEIICVDSELGKLMIQRYGTVLKENIKIQTIPKQ